MKYIYDAKEGQFEKIGDRIVFTKNKWSFAHIHLKFKYPILTCSSYF